MNFSASCYTTLCDEIGLPYFDLSFFLIRLVCSLEDWPAPVKGIVITLTAPLTNGSASNDAMTRIRFPF